MKIQKRKTIKASEEVVVIPVADANIADECPTTPESVITLVAEPCDPKSDAYCKAIDSIICAIEHLGAVAKDDTLARESIANLSVVLFDLKC